MMKSHRFIFLILFLGLYLTACNHIDEVGTTPLARDELEPVSTSIKTSVLESSSDYHIQSVSVNEIKQNEECIPSVNTSISEMEISQDARLLLYDEEENNLTVYSPSANLLEYVPGIQSEELSYGIDISPSNKWLIYQVFNSKRDGIAYYDHWISDVEGISSWKLASDVAGGTDTDWVLEDMVVFTGYFGRVNCPNIIEQVDPFSGVVQDVPVISTNFPYCILNQGFNPDGTQRLELGYDGFILNDFNTGQTTEIFPWFSDYLSENGAGSTISFAWLESGVSIVVIRKDRIDYILDLPTVSSQPFDVEVERITFDEYGEILNGSDVLYSPQKLLIGLDILDDETWDYTDYELQPATHFVLLNLAEYELTEYCIDRTKYDSDDGIGSPRFPTRLSPDGRYLAWTITELPYNHPSIYVAVLDLLSGQVGYLRGPYRLEGWVVVKSE